MTNIIIAKISTTYASKILKGIKYERIKKVLPDGKVFSTIKETLKNGDSFCRTKLNGKTVVTVLKQNFIEANSGNNSTGITIRRFLKNGNTIITDKFKNLRNDLLIYTPNNGYGYSIIPAKRTFPTVETIITKDFYKKGEYPSKRIFSSVVQESPIGTTGVYYNNVKNTKWKEMGFLKTKFWEENGKIKPYEYYDRYVK